MIYLNKTFTALKITLLLSICIVICTVLYIGGFTDKPVFSVDKQKIIIDAGHGLPDGGAVAADGTIESDLNLAIAKLVYEKLNAVGFDCLMMRSDQNSIFTDGNTIHAKKYPI